MQTVSFSLICMIDLSILTSPSPRLGLTVTGPTRLASCNAEKYLKLVTHWALRVLSHPFRSKGHLSCQLYPAQTFWHPFLPPVEDPTNQLLCIVALLMPKVAPITTPTYPCGGCQRIDGPTGRPRVTKSHQMITLAHPIRHHFNI